jgi:hypothetical protein
MKEHVRPEGAPRVRRADQEGYAHHHGYRLAVAAPAGELFSYIDDQSRLSSHMGESSWKMGGGKMTIELDAAGGKRVGSRIRLSGRVFGIPLSVDEVVIERSPPHRKLWETIGEPRLLVIGSYRMGFEITPDRARSLLHVFIDYDLPVPVRWRWLGVLLGAYYAKWCTRQMAEDAAHHFALGKTHCPSTETHHPGESR